MSIRKWNKLNNLEDLVFVLDIETEEYLLTNNVFNELVGYTESVLDIDVKEILPKREGDKDSIKGILQYLDTVGDTCVMDFEQEVANSVVPIKMIIGYFDDEHTQLYFQLKGYGSIVEFIRFRKSIAKLPEMIAILEFDEKLSFSFGNDAFEETFSTKKLSFTQKYKGSFLQFIPEEERDGYYIHLQEEFEYKNKTSSVIEYHSQDGEKHYAMIHIAKMIDVLDHPFLCATITNVDNDVEIYLRLLEENKIFNLTHQFSNSIVFKLDILENEIEFIGDSIANFYLEGVQKDFMNQILKRELVYKEDVDTFKNLVINIKNGVEKPCKIRLNAEDGRKDWYFIEYVCEKNREGQPLYATGKITNVQKNQELQERADRDLLTGCLNKVTFADFTQRILREDEAGMHAFIMLDIDDFKKINDNLGHYFGDIVLKEVSDKLKKIFRSSDYIGRIGGDEFVIFMRNINSEDIVEVRVKEIVKALDIAYKKNKIDYRITVSVGISLAPYHGAEYSTLYQCADKALYHAKYAGKNNFVFYNDVIDKGDMTNRTPIDVANRALSAHFNQEVAMDVFNLLFANIEDEDSVNIVLRHLGEYFHVDRCYIFELDEEYDDAYNNTFEWCRESIEPQIEFLQCVSLSAFQELFDSANQDGVYYSNDIDRIETKETRETLQVQGIQSFVLTFVKKDEQVEYVLGFDDCSSKRVWKPVEISTLTYASKIIAQYLSYRQSIRKTVKLTQDRLKTLDSFNFYGYAVDIESYELIYFNNKLKETFPDIELGEVCYNKIRGFDSPCKECPIRILEENQASRSRMVIRNDILKQDFLVTASYVDNYEGKKTAFVSSTEMTDILSKIDSEILDRNEFTIHESVDE